MKKSLSIFLSLLTICMLATYFKPIKTTTFATEELSTSSTAAILADFNSGTVIYSKNEKEKLPIASMCKIMTLLLCFEEIDAKNITFDEEIVVSENASGMGGSQVFLEANEKYKVKDLLKSIVVASANDACVAMAERICGSETAFVNKMNEKCETLGMTSTHFVNCTGLPKPEQYSCAKDVATMFTELLKHKEYYGFSKIWMDKIYHSGDKYTEISNTNKLIRFYDGCDSGKTGYTSEAGHCLAASAFRNGMRLVGVVIKAQNSKERFNDVLSMFNYGFANFENKKIVDKFTPLNVTAEVEKGKKDTVQAVASEDFFLFSRKNEKIALDIDFMPDGNLIAPIQSGDKIGKISIYRNNVLIKEIDVLSNEDVNKLSYFDVIKNVIDEWSI